MNGVGHAQTPFAVLGDGNGNGGNPFSGSRLGESGLTCERTFSTSTITTTSTRTAGGNTFVTADRTAVITGSFTGPTSDTATLVFHSDGTTSIRGVGTCACTVDGISGTASYQFVGSGTFPSSVSGQYVVQGSGGLAGLHAQGPFSGSFLAVSYGGQLHFS